LPAQTHWLSKSRVLAGLQCHKRLWWTVHEPSAPELEPVDATLAVMDRGTRVGELARSYVPGGVFIDLPYDAYSERIAFTNEALQNGAPAIYEASFRADGVFTAIDILKREERGFRLIEVKSTTSVKEQHIPDVAVQAYVLRQNGLDVVGADVMHLNRACAYPDLSNLFVRSDVSEAVRVTEASVPTWIAEQLNMLEAPLPNVATGPHCTTPYGCPFMSRCWPSLPPNHVSALYRMKQQRALDLEDQGYPTIFDLPEDVSLGAIADRQRRAVREGGIIVEPTLPRALEVFIPPIAFIDFETLGLPVPVWNGCHPYDQVPVQFSCHVQNVDGSVSHHEWLAEGSGDPRPQLAAALIDACASARTVVAYNASFERGCIREMADAFPALAPQLLSIAARLVDLLPIVRNHVYHPKFDASFSLKKVLPALVPELSYDGLPISQGASASLELERLLFTEFSPDEKMRLRSDLLKYCHQDTWGLVKVLEYLNRQAN
jgi:predicted RecB family nuclease